MMKDQLNQCLRQARVPDRSPGYWEVFPRRVVSRLAEESRLKAAPTRQWGWALGATAVILVVTLVTLFRPTRPAGPDYAKLYREIAAVFPGQVEAIVADAGGVRLVLSETPQPRSSMPLLVRACSPTGCRSVITFSGQQVPINGDHWDVLLDGADKVIVAGRTAGNYRIEGGLL